jgi:hypothetical protein
MQPKDKYIVVENTHKPIVGREDFDSANAEVKQMTNSYITAKNDLLRATIEKKMNGACG